MRGEIVVVVAGAERADVAFPEAVSQVLALVAEGTRLKDAAAEVAGNTGHSSRELYQEAIAARAAGEGGFPSSREAPTASHGGAPASVQTRILW